MDVALLTVICIVSASFAAWFICVFADQIKPLLGVS